MFESIRALAAAWTGAASPARAFAETDYRLAATALFVHVAEADGRVVALERARMRGLIATRFGLDAASTAELLRQGELSDHEAADFTQFADVLRRALDADGRRKIIDMMSEIAWADGELHEFEENIIARVAEMLGVEPPAGAPPRGPGS